MQALLFCCFVAAVSAYSIPSGHIEVACDPDTPPRELNATQPGLFRSENWPNGTYPPNANCEWAIYQDEGLSLTLEFLNFTLEASENCKSDYVEVYQGDTDDEANLVGRYCGQTPPAAITATGNALFVRFVSDASVNYQGFLARYGETQDRTACSFQRPQVITQSAGVILTPDYPGDYPNNALCDWRFEAAEGQTWTIEFADLETENCCDCDYVDMFDGFASFNTRLGRWFGTNTLPPRITTSANGLYVRFVSDFSVRAPGFIAAYVRNDAE